MNIIGYALNEIRAAIPPEVLEMAFVDTDWQNTLIGTPLSVDSMIREKVIQARVIPNCNLKGGREVTIPVHGLVPQTFDNRWLVYQIPKHLTDGASIVSVLSITYGAHPDYGGAFAQARNAHQGSLLNTAIQILTSSQQIYAFASVGVQLIGENTILVKESAPIPSNAFFRVQLEHDSMFSSLPPKAWDVFAQMCIAAVKNYIYIHHRVRIDEGVVQGGYQIGALANFVEEYSDANEIYREILTQQWGKTVHSADPERMARTIGLQIGLGR